MSDTSGGGEKTEQPSGRKLGRARAKGQTAQSREINTWFMLMASAGLIMFAAPPLALSIARLLVAFLEFDHFLGPEDVLWNAVEAALGQVANALIVPLLMLLVAAVAGTIAQIGLVFALDKFDFSLKGMSPLGGLKRMFSPKSFIELIRNLLKIAAVGAIVGWLVLPSIQQLPMLIASPIEQLPSSLYHTVLHLILGVLVPATVIAAIDYAYQRFSFMRQMKMSKQEVKEENKQSEGDPAIKGRLRQIRADRARKRMMASVPKASVVITNPTHYAVALQYEMGATNAPKLVAKGVDFLAARIREIAEAHDIPIVENPPLARTLYATVEVDHEIPPEHYKAVAEIIGYVFRLKGKMKR